MTIIIKQLLDRNIVNQYNSFKRPSLKNKKGHIFKKQKSNIKKQLKIIKADLNFQLIRIAAKIKSRILIFNQYPSIHSFSITHRAMSPPNSSYDVTRRRVTLDIRRL